MLKFICQITLAIKSDCVDQDKDKFEIFKNIYMNNNPSTEKSSNGKTNNDARKAKLKKKSEHKKSKKLK